MGFVPDHIVPDCVLTILAQNPGADEEAGKQIVGFEQIGHRTHPSMKRAIPNP